MLHVFVTHLPAYVHLSTASKFDCIQVVSLGCRCFQNYTKPQHITSHRETLCHTPHHTTLSLVIPHCTLLHHTAPHDTTPLPTTPCHVIPLFTHCLADLKVSYYLNVTVGRTAVEQQSFIVIFPCNYYLQCLNQWTYVSKFGTEDFFCQNSQAFPIFSHFTPLFSWP